jgi:hypothetical protein
LLGRLHHLDRNDREEHGRYADLIQKKTQDRDVQQQRADHARTEGRAPYPARDLASTVCAGLAHASPTARLNLRSIPVPEA